MSNLISKHTYNFNETISIYNQNLCIKNRENCWNIHIRQVFVVIFYTIGSENIQAGRNMTSQEIKKITVNFPEKYKSKTYEVGSILNKNIINSLPFTKENNSEGKFSILVLGGSQGAEIFGTVIPTVVKMIKEAGYEIKINLTANHALFL